MIRRLTVWLFLLSIVCPPLSAQWAENFDHITALTSPPWRGQIADFAIIKKQLKLYVEYPDDLNESRIAITVPYFKTTTWKGDVKLDFRPTINNYLYCYLYCYGEISDSEFDYVALRWGSGSKGVDLLDVRLRVLPSGESSIVRSDILIDGSAYPLGTKPFTSFTVTYAVGSGWQLWVNGADDTGNETVLIGSSSFDVESPFQSGGLGIDCFYTKSRSKAFSFDNLSVSEGTVSPPEEEEEPIPLGKPTLNELMANPLEGGSEYIELYNPTDKPVVPSKFAIGILRNGSYTTTTALPTVADTLYPGQYIVFAKKSEGVTDFDPQAQNVVTMSNLPQLANKGFTIGLFEEGLDQPLEEVVYSPKMLGEGNVTRRGVSLERISFETPASDPTNWAGGLPSAGYATPGYLNSQSSNADTTQLGLPNNETEGNGKSYLPPASIAEEVLLLPKGSLCGSAIYLMSAKTVKYIDGTATKRWCRKFSEGKDLGESMGLPSGYSYLIVVWIQRPDSMVYARKCIVTL